MYMSSTSTGDGSLYLTVTFKQGADVDRAQVQVQKPACHRRCRGFLKKSATSVSRRSRAHLT